MHRNYLKMALRYLFKNKVHSFINIAGLSVGMTVAMLIGLWIWDECTYNHFTTNHTRIAQVYRNRTINGETSTVRAIAIPLPGVLKEEYGQYFKAMTLASWTWSHILTVGDRKLLQKGNFMEPAAADMFSLEMLQGSRNGLSDPNSILLSQTAASSLFGDVNPMDKLIRIDNNKSLKVAGVYKDFPYNSDFNNVSFIGPWDYYVNYSTTVPPTAKTDWGNNSFMLYVQLADNVDFATANAKIAHAIQDHSDGNVNMYNPIPLLHPMSRWHLYNKFEGGFNMGGAIHFVWLFGIIGLFVLLLACINFMNLSTAKSEKRAKEVGIRKAIGSQRQQLIAQFFTESLFVTGIAYIMAIILVVLLLPAFNQVADKHIALPWSNPLFWLAGLTFTVLTGMIAGSYPAFYLSSFQPVKVLKGAYKAGRYASIPRRVLVVLQFSVSVTLIIGTIIVFQQIEYGRNRPVNYNKDGLVTVTMQTTAIAEHFESLRQELLGTGTISEVSLSTSSTTGIDNNTSSVSWEGKDPNMGVDFGNIGITFQYGKTVGWQFAAGRDFNAGLLSDSNAVVVNERAIAYMDMKDPIGKILHYGSNPFTIIGVIKDMVMEDPYETPKPTLFYIKKRFWDNYINIRIRPHSSPVAAVAHIEAACKKYDPESPVNYHFNNAEYASKFDAEMRIGKLAGIFAILAIFISCLGLFGMASFMAEQRTKELGIRKILGASIFNLWGLLSKEFVILVTISFLIAMPLTYMSMQGWLSKYAYHTNIPWWVFVAAAVGALCITLLTVSFQGIRAALMNPVKSLKTE